MREAGNDLIQFLTGAVFTGLSAWLILGGNPIAWMGVVFGLLCAGHAVYEFGVRRKVRADRVRASQLSAHIADALSDDVEVWLSLLEGVDASWVVFENGTLVLCGASPDPQKSALQTIERYFQITPGTDSADFSVALRADAGVWVVSFSEGVFGFVRVAECELETAAGLLAREALKEDASHARIMYVHALAR